ncbi:MAG: ABC transporter ATP-binding protein [Caldilineae bacterium]|nr:MAG: ABC transporter ATP-binding protein [Caldilineae bacterium]
MQQAIIVEHLQKRYGEVEAVADISFQVEAGEIFGMVGPNGAGKTTTIECMEGLRRQDGGTIRILDMDPQEQGPALRERIGVQLQEAALPPRLKVWEACDLFASFYSHTVPWPPLLEKLGLAEKRDSYVGKLSGGQRQRLFIVLALLNDPEVVFLDELTTGLDPQARRTMWELVREIRDQGKTLFLTTHFMDEAERLCDRVAIIDRGRLIALDSPENLIRSLNAEHRIIFTVNGNFPAERFASLPGVARLEQVGERVILYGRGDMPVSRVVQALESSHVAFRDLRTEQPNLEDVFLALTGREMHPGGDV